MSSGMERRAASPEGRRRRAHALPPLLGNLLLSLASVGAVLCLGEWVGRRFERSTPPRSSPTYIADWADWDGDFYTVKSTAVGWPPWEDYNRDGLRDREHADAKPNGTRRVVCLGDSTTLGFHLRPEEAYPQTLQDRASALGWNVEVFNVALGGWLTRQQLIAYRRIARRYRPDLVLLGICLNDFAEMRNNLTRPPAILARLHEQSALVRRLVRAQDREIGSIGELFAEPASAKVEDGFRRVFGDLRTLRDEVRADGARLAVLSCPLSAAARAGRSAAGPSNVCRVLCGGEDSLHRSALSPGRPGGSRLRRSRPSQPGRYAARCRGLDRVRTDRWRAGTRLGHGRRWG